MAQPAMARPRVPAHSDRLEVEEATAESTDDSFVLRLLCDVEGQVARAGAYETLSLLPKQSEDSPMHSGEGRFGDTWYCCSWRGRPALGRFPDRVCKLCERFTHVAPLVDSIASLVRLTPLEGDVAATNETTRGRFVPTMQN